MASLDSTKRKDSSPSHRKKDSRHSPVAKRMSMMEFRKLSHIETLNNSPKGKRRPDSAGYSLRSRSSSPPPIFMRTFNNLTSFDNTEDGTPLESKLNLLLWIFNHLKDIPLKSPPPPPPPKESPNDSGSLYCSFSLGYGSLSFSYFISLSFLFSDSSGSLSFSSFFCVSSGSASFNSFWISSSLLSYSSCMSGYFCCWTT